MVFTTIAFSVIFALIFSILLAYVFKRRGPGPAGGVLFIFLIIFMFTWAIGTWVEPIGPVTWGVPWLSYLIIAFFITLVIGALIPSASPRPPVITKPELDEEVSEEAYPADLTLAEVEARHIRRVIQKSSGNLSRAAAGLGISRSTLWRKMKRYGITNVST